MPNIREQNLHLQNSNEKNFNKNSTEGYVTTVKSSFPLDNWFLILVHAHESEQTIPVLLRHNHYTAGVKFLHKKSFSLGKMELNKVDTVKFGFVQQSLKRWVRSETTLALHRQCNDVKIHEVSFQYSF